jgi:hypothetical protein
MRIGLAIVLEVSRENKSMQLSDLQLALCIFVLTGATTYALAWLLWG